MNVLDLILAIPLGLLLWKGYRKGAIFEFVNLFGLAIGVWAAFRFCRKVMELLSLDGDSAILIAFFVTFVAVVVLAHLLGKLVERFVKLVKAGFANHLLGALFGMLQGVCILSVLLYYVTVLDPHEHILTPHAKESSLLYRPVTRTGDRVIGGLKTYVASHRDLPFSNSQSDDEC